MTSPYRSTWLRLIAVGCGILASVTAEATVIVITNRATTEARFKLEEAGQAARDFRMAAGEVTPIALQGSASIAFDSAGRSKNFQVAPHGLYYFSEPQAGQLELGQIGLSTPEIKLPAEVLAQLRLPVNTAVQAAGKRKCLVIPVKILYDDAEISTHEAWERRLRTRFAEASSVIKRHAFVEFEIVAVESWKSHGAIGTLEQLLDQFERAVDPAPARVAIGFTGQKPRNINDGHMGGTRGPLHSHLLIREHVHRNTEAERTELLIHELGHFLGSAHSPEKNSVMRPVLGDRQARRTKFRVQFDPLNTLAMCLVTGEMSGNQDLKFADMQPTTRIELLRLYRELSRANPDDPTADRYLQRLQVRIVSEPRSGDAALRP